MSIKLKIGWTDNNVILEGVRIYKSSALFDVSSLPAVYAEIIDGSLFYEDFNVIEGHAYFYMLSCFLGEQEVFTACFEANVTLIKSYYPSDENVISLIVADAQIFPSTSIVDKKGVAIISTSDRPVQVAKPEFSTGGAFECNTNDEHVGINSSQYAFNYQDFVIECEILLPTTAISTAYQWQIINTGSQYGIPGRAASIGVAGGQLTLSTRPSSSTSYWVNYNTGHFLEPDKKYHIAFMRRENIFYIFVDGVQVFMHSEAISLTVNSIQFMRYAGTALRFINSIRVSREAFYPVDKDFLVDTSYIV